MDTLAIIETLDKEIARLQEARAILGAAANVKGAASIKRGPGRPKKLATVTGTKKRVISAEAKEKMAAAAKARWAKVKRAAKKVAKTEAAA
jgi:hypothetical protein